MALPLRIERETTGPTVGVVTVFLDEPDQAVTVLNCAMMERLDATLDEVGDNPTGLVLATSHGRVFVAGADLHEITDLPDGELDEYLALGQRTLGRIAALPCCTVAAINGAALGGGLELALYCDVLVGMEPAGANKPYPIGLPEASLGLCPGWGGTNMLPARIDPERAIDMIASGATLTVLDAQEAGLIDQLYAGRDELLSASRARAAEPKPQRASRTGEPINISCVDVAPRVRAALAHSEIGLAGDAAADAVVEAVKTGLAHGWTHALECERRLLIALRSTESSKSKIQAFFERVSKREKPPKRGAPSVVGGQKSRE